MAALAALTLSVSIAIAKESPVKQVRNDAQNTPRASVVEIWTVDYRSSSALAEATSRDPLLEWAMAMKKRILEQGTNRWQGFTYGPMVPVNPDDEQMSIDKH